MLIDNDVLTAQNHTTPHLCDVFLFWSLLLLPLSFASTLSVYEFIFVQT